MLTFLSTLQMVLVVLMPPQPHLPHQVSGSFLFSLSLEHEEKPKTRPRPPCDAAHCCLTCHC